MVEQRPVKQKVESSSLSRIANNWIVIVSKEKVKVCQAQKLFTSKTQTDKLFLLQNDGSPKWKSRDGLQNRCKAEWVWIP